MFPFLCESNCERESQSHVVACVRVHESLEPVGYNNLTFLHVTWEIAFIFLGSEARMSEQTIVMLFNGLCFKVCGPAWLWFCFCSYFEQIDTWPCHFCLGSKSYICFEECDNPFLSQAFLETLCANILHISVTTFQTIRLILHAIKYFVHAFLNKRLNNMQIEMFL